MMPPPLRRPCLDGVHHSSYSRIIKRIYVTRSLYRCIFVSRIVLLAGSLLVIYITSARAQRELSGAAEAKLALDRLNVTGSVLMIGAHPDDENTAVLAYFARGRKVRTGYLSLTRGEGGQNKLGSNLFDVLGVLRTLELLASDRAAEVFRSIASIYDMVLIDSPPVLPVTDAAVITRLAEGTILIASASSWGLRPSQGRDLASPAGCRALFCSGRAWCYSGYSPCSGFGCAGSK